MEFRDYYPIWTKLTAKEQSILESAVRPLTIKKGAVVYSADRECMGPLIISSGQLRGVIYSEEGKEITVYRLFERDFCLFSASCMMRSIQFDITIIAEKDTTAWLIPADVYKRLMSSSAPIANFTNEIMGERLTDVMWLIEQIMWKSFDKRLAKFLLDEADIEENSTLKITHEQIAAHLGTAREVVTRMLKYFETDGLVRLARGVVELLDRDALESLL